jgi:Tfp pilus assembly protein PilF
MIIRKSVWTGVLLLVWVPQVVAEESAGCDPWVAKVVSLQGQVEAKRRAASDWQVIKLDTTYCSGDSLRVGENSRAALVLSNDTLLRLDQNSAITLTAISKESPSLLEILTGLVHFISRVPHSLKVNTPYVNAAIEGTEFVVAVNKDSATVTVFEGSVLAQNAAGEVRITHNETAQALAGGAPQKILLAKPRDAVQWALYYPPVFSDPAPLPFVEASDLLYQGRIEAAREKIKKLPPSDDSRLPHDDFLLANRKYKIAASNTLEAIIAVVQNDKDRALQLAQEAVNEMPTMAATYIALSYAQQAQFDLDAATQSATRATTVEPNNALAFARLAELQLSRGYLNAALLSAQRATQLDSKQARAQTILGFAYLTQIHVAEATQVFNTAIELDQADPLPHLGLGLAKIRKNNLAEGRRDIEIAALLDPNNALIRSYLGKAYFEEKRPRIDADQFAMAKELDPNDPTPWFYDAIRKQTENRPVEALEDLQKSIELNGNRAVYRSRLQLDQDEAARSASLARIYSDLGFEQSALIEATRSLHQDPANHSAHRFLSDLYSTRTRHEIARASEMLQAQLLQPNNINPIPPQFVETDLGVITSAGPVNASYGEYNHLFTRDSINAQTNLIGGNNATKGDNILVSGIYGPTSLGFSQFHYESEGYRPNNDIKHNIYDFLVQSRLTNVFSVLADYKKRNTSSGDLLLRFDPEDFYPNKRNNTSSETTKVGFNYKHKQNNNLLGLLKWDRHTENINDYETGTIPFDFTSTTTTGVDEKSKSAELQYIINESIYNVISGIGYINKNRNSTETTVLDVIVPPVHDVTTTPSELVTNYKKGYLYTNFNNLGDVKLTAGASYSDYESDRFRFNQMDYSLGAIYKASNNLTLRFALLSSINAPIVADQTIEPTQIAGFNQFFDDLNGSKTKRSGIGLDYFFSGKTKMGFETSLRKIEAPSTAGLSVEFDDLEERLNSIYLYSTLTNQVSLAINSELEVFRNPNSNILATPTEIKTSRTPIAIIYNSQNGYALKTFFIHVDQTYRDVSNNIFTDTFWVTNILVSYKFPLRTGQISLGVNNAFDEKFSYYDIEYTGAQKTPLFQPARTVFAQINFVL